MNSKSSFHIHDLFSGGSKGGAPPHGPKIFSISCSFFGNFWQNCRLAPPPLGLVPPPTGNPGSAPAFKCKNNCDINCLIIYSSSGQSCGIVWKRSCLVCTLWNNGKLDIRYDDGQYFNLNLESGLFTQIHVGQIQLNMKFSFHSACSLPRKGQRSTAWR